MKHRTKCALTILCVILSPFLLYYGGSVMLQAGGHVLDSAYNFEMGLFGLSTITTGSKSTTTIQIVKNLGSSPLLSYYDLSSYYTRPALWQIDRMSDSQINSLLSGHQVVTSEYTVNVSNVTSLGDMPHNYCNDIFEAVPTDSKSCVILGDKMIIENVTTISSPTWQLTVTIYQANINSTLLCVSLNIIIIIGVYMIPRTFYVLTVRKREH